MEITDEMASMIEDINEQNIELEDIDLDRVRIEDFQDLEIRKVLRRNSARRNSARRMETRELQSSEVKNSLIQDNSVKIQVVGSNVEALCPSLEAIEVAQIVYKSIMESEVRFRGVDYQEACSTDFKDIRLISER